jgi:hypothetical protein
MPRSKPSFAEKTKRRKPVAAGRRRRRNGLFDFVTRKKVTYHGKIRGRTTRKTQVTAGKSVRYEGATIYRTPQGGYATDVANDYDSTFDTLNDAKRFVKSWKKGMHNPRHTAAVGNPSQQRFLSARFNGHDAESYRASQQNDGNFTGSTRPIYPGARVHVLKRGRGGRVLIMADYYDTPYYGWADESDVVTKKRFIEQHGYDPLEGRDNPAKFDRCVREVEARGGGVNAYAVCTAAGTRGNPSQVGSLTKMLEGTNVMGDSPREELANYHHARLAIAAGRKKALGARFSAVRQALKNNRVTVSLDGDAIRIHRPDTGQTIYVGPKQNPEPAAAALSSSFHGRPAESVTTYADDVHTHEYLTELGDLVEITVNTESGYRCELDFKGEGLKLASNESGTQLFIQGRSKLDLGKMHMGGAKWKTEQMILGRIVSLVYRTSKQQDDGEVVDYIHKSGEALDASGQRHVQATDIYPQLGYDTLNSELFIVGGMQRVRPEGIIN